MAIPIWKDTFYKFPQNVLRYSISDGNSTIFAGVAYKYPDAASGSVKVNNICSYHLNSEIPQQVFNTTTGSVVCSGMSKTFTLYNNSGNSISAYTFYNDWSYATGGNALSQPVNGIWATGMYCLQSTLNGNNIQLAWKKGGGNGYTKQGCGDWAVYYCNRRSGWDGLLLQKVVEMKSIETYGYSRVVDNNTISRESIRIQSNINPKFRMSTPWLTDAQSENVYNNLLSSNHIWLHNLNTNVITPIHITDSEVTKKVFDNERTLIHYTINTEGDNLQIIR